MDQCTKPQICVICQQERNDILRILDKAVCTDCEKEMVVVKTTDLAYDFYVARLKEIW